MTKSASSCSRTTLKISPPRRSAPCLRVIREMLFPAAGTAD
jgi:hypothetical protein